MISPKYKFLDVGMNGRNSNVENLFHNQLKNALENNTLNLPEPRPLPGQIKKLHMYVRRFSSI